MPGLSEVAVKCGAKINLTLDILDKRPDGYHNLRSVMQSISLVDILIILRTNGTGIEVISGREDIPSGPGNTVYKAAELFRSAAGIEGGISVTIEKHIPHQAGMGGGSSDAAGALLGLNRLFGSSLTDNDLLNLAAKIGSDVPYFIIGGTAVVSGRGEVVERLPDAPGLDLVVVKPEIGVPTAWAYQRLAEMDRLKSSEATEAIVEAIYNRDRKSVIGNLSNDFDGIVSAEFPVIVEIKERLTSLGAEKSMLSGSGAAVLGIFEGQDSAEEARKAMEPDYPFTVATTTTRKAVEVLG